MVVTKGFPLVRDDIGKEVDFRGFFENLERDSHLIIYWRGDVAHALDSQMSVFLFSYYTGGDIFGHVLNGGDLLGGLPPIPLILEHVVQIQTGTPKRIAFVLNLVIREKTELRKRLQRIMLRFENLLE